jgi:hypothetical protein
MNPNLSNELRHIIDYDKNINSDTRIPLIYQYLHSKDKYVDVSSGNTVGEVYNIRENIKGDIIGDVKLYPMTRLSGNFQGTIDNLMADYNPITKSTNIKAFIIYDKEAKQRIIDKKSENKASEVSIKSGEIPLASNLDNIKMKDITDKLLEEYEKLVANKQNDNPKEKGDI